MSAFLTPDIDWLNTDVVLLCGSWDSELRSALLCCKHSTTDRSPRPGNEFIPSPPPLTHTYFLTDMLLAKSQTQMRF